MWLERLKEMKKSANMSTKEIAEKAKLPEDTVSRILTGKTEDPRIDTIHRIVEVLGGSMDVLFCPNGEADKNAAELQLLAAEATALRNEITALRQENDVLRIQLNHKEELLAVHNYYIQREEAAKHRSGTKILR